MSKKVILDYNLGDTIKEEQALHEIGADLVKTYWTNEDAMVKICSDPEVIALLVGPIAQISKRIINAAPNLKIISRTGIGYNNIDVEAATARNIPVSIILDYCVNEVADHAMAFILIFNRNLIPLDKIVKSGRWSDTTTDIPKARADIPRLSQTTLGIVGIGRIGRTLASRAIAFGIKVIAFDPYISAADAAKSGIQLVDFNTLITTADFISLHAPLTKETSNLFTLDNFKKMKRTAYLINNARGGLINESALYTALKEGYLAGAGLDVTNPEPPLTNNPLLTLDNVLITGHSSWYSKEAVIELRWKSVAAIIGYLNGKWPDTLANPEVKKK
jgi:D-3-phosphoglycerate dehydrogenase / 2-oxoglutarate reductase